MTEIEKKKTELNTLCEEIARMVPSKTLKDTATSQFKEFLVKLKANKVRDTEIDAIVQSYNYFNQLMKIVGEDPVTKSVSKTESKEETTQTKSETATAVAIATETATKESKMDDSNDVDLVELLLNLSEESEPKVII